MASIQDNSAAETAEQIEVQTGRREPFTMVFDWLLLAPIRPQAKVLYWALSAHINTSREDNEVWPTQAMLAEMLGFAPLKSSDAGLCDGRKIRPFLAELVAIDAVVVRKSRRYAGGMRTRNIYIVHQSPPEGYPNHTSLKKFYLARKARIAAAQTEQLELALAAGPEGQAK